MRKNKLLLLLALLLTAATGAWAQDYYAPSTDEVIILNDVYEYTYNGRSSHSAIAWGGAATPSMRKAGDPNNEGVSTSSTVSCYSVKGTGQDKDITLSITGVSKVIVYHERNSSRYIELRDGSKTGNIIGSGEKNTWYTEVELTATNQYSIFLHGTSTGSNDQDFYVYAIKLIAAPAAPADPAAGYTVSMKDGVKDADKWTVKVGEGQAQALPIGGLKGDGSETVTLQYNGRLKVKGVKATSDAPAAPASTTLNNTITAWTAGSYAVPAGGLTYSDAITVSGDVTLTLTDGETLTLNKGISLASGATLTVEGNGTMNVNGTNENTTSTVAGSTGTLILTSGTLTATGGNGGSVDVVESDAHGGNGGVAINGSVIVSGGSLTARGGNGGSVDFQCSNCSGGNGGDAISGSVTVSGGTLTASGGNGGSVGDYGSECSGGNGGDAISGTLTKNGGSTSVNDGSNGSIGEECDGCTAGKGGKGKAGSGGDIPNSDPYTPGGDPFSF